MASIRKTRSVGRRRLFDPGLAVLLALVASLSCTRPAQPEARTPSPHLTLRSIGASEPSREARRLASMPVPVDLGTWTVEQGEYRIIRDGTGPEERRFLRVKGEEQLLLTVPLPAEARDFNRVLVVLRSYAHIEKRGIRVDLRMESGETVTGEGQVPLPSPSPQVLSFAFPRLRGIEGKAEELQLSTFGENSELFLERIDLVDSPLASWLPDPDREAGLVQIGPEARRAVGLSNRRPIGAVVRPTPGTALAFSHALPELLQLPGPAPG